MKRVFIALNLPEQIKEELFDLVLKLQKSNKNKPIKWVEKENFHLTLHFLADIAEEKIEDINTALKNTISNFQSLNFSLSNSIDAFPDLYNPRVIYLKINELDQGKIFQLQKQIGDSLLNKGFEISLKPFRLHLTIGRVKAKCQIKIPGFELQGSDFSISSVELMESKLTGSGPIYSIINSYKLN